MDTDLDNIKKYNQHYKYILNSVICHNGEMHIGHYHMYQRFQYHDDIHWVLFHGQEQVIVKKEDVQKADGVT